jgi:hypothetical protein
MLFCETRVFGAPTLGTGVEYGLYWVVWHEKLSGAHAIQNGYSSVNPPYTMTRLVFELTWSSIKSGCA